ncbi:hypothetical protein VTP01DRAFT_677 [Rhizomucor pusillus]|uniref:uncharacterized protein n=1 Tax=Rhizomucor pusillus TaxID=4840 RepID=UPI0037436A96
MSAQLLYEDGQGNVVDENGRPEPMDYIVGQKQYVLETISSHSICKKLPAEQSPQANAMQVAKPRDEDSRMREVTEKRVYTRYTPQDKARFFKRKIERYMSTSAAAKQLDIHVRTAQRWVKRYDERPNSIFESGEKKVRRHLTSEHKKTIIDFTDAVVVEVTEHLMKHFKDLKVSHSTVYNFMRTECNLSLKKAEFQSMDGYSPEKIKERYDWVRDWEQTDMNFLTNCVFLDESAFHINMKRTRIWSKKGVPAVVILPTTTAKTTTILGAISASGLIKVSLGIPKPNRERKAD